MSTEIKKAESGRVKLPKLLDGTALKLIAMVSMVFDHVGDNFFPEQTWMRVIGRIAMPIFAFCVAEGFIPILLYNGKRGRGLKWLFYAFYPGHLLLIWLIKTLIAK